MVRETSARQWCRRFMTSFPLMDTVNKQSLVIQFPLKEIQKLVSCMTPTLRVTEKMSTLKQVGKAETRWYHSPHPQWSTLLGEGTPNSKLLSEEKRVWTAHLAPQFSWLSPKELAPRHLMRFYISNSPRDHIT